MSGLAVVATAAPFPVSALPLSVVVHPAVASSTPINTTPTRVALPMIDSPRSGIS
jgi:hypothetical protein